jgi:hypothetical protein
MRHMSMIIPTCSCPQKLWNLKNLTRNSSAITKRVSVIMTMTVKTPSHHEVMGMVALGNW